MTGPDHRSGASKRRGRPMLGPADASVSVRDERHRSVAREYDRLADRYEARWRHYVRASVRETLARLDLRPGLRLLDVGCGTGALLRAALSVEPAIRGFGIDVSPGMLARAHEGLAGRAGLALADAHDLPFGPDRFDLVVSSSAFHYWSDPARALSEIGRVLAPGGRLAVTDWCDDFLACRIFDRALRLLSRSHRRIYGSGECRELLERSGYEVVALDRYKIDWLWGLMTARAVRNDAAEKRGSAV